MNVAYHQSRDRLQTDMCAQCGTPLLDFEELQADVAGTQELLCDGYCAGLRRQDLSVALINTRKGYTLNDHPFAALRVVHMA